MRTTTQTMATGVDALGGVLVVLLPVPARTERRTEQRTGVAA
ncbi:hypothetical protein [Nocardioides sp. URHA0020]|nr:hypothetical protein [Nocardioides sp. URHA0020]